MPNAQISQVKIGSSVYDIKDAYARERIAELEQFTDFIGVTTTALTDGATTNPITINSESVTAKKGNIVLYGNSEFIFDGTTWHLFGDLGALGDLAYKNTASGSYTPAGSVSAPTISVASAGATDTVEGMATVGTLPSCTLPTMSVSGEILEFTAGSFSAGTLPTKASAKTFKTGDASYTATAPSFTGTAATITVS